MRTIIPRRSASELLIFQAKNLQKPYKGCRRYEMRKPFEDLTIADDFMFCKIMEHESLCRPLLRCFLPLISAKSRIYRLRMVSLLIQRQKQSGLIYWSKTMPVHPMILKCRSLIDIRVYQRTRVLPCSKTSLLLTGCQWFQAVASFSVEKLAVQECARTHILERWHPCRY